MPKVNIKHPRRSRRLMPSHLQQKSTRKARLQHNNRNLRTNDIIPCPLQQLLPSEIIGDILFGGYLNKSPKQISVVRAVCVQFRSLASSFCTSLNAKPSFLRKRKIAFSTRMLSNILQQFPCLISVDFSYLGETFTDRHLQLLSPLRDQLRVLKLRGTTVGSGGLEDYFGVTDTNVWKTYPLPLEELDLSKTLLSDSNRVGGTVIEALVACCPNLLSLQLSMCHKIDDATLELLSSGLTNLQELDLSMCNITPRGCCHLSRLSSLRVVNISSALDVSGQAIRSIITGNCPPNYRCNSNDDLNSDYIKEKQYMEHSSAPGGTKKATSNLRVIVAQFATSGLDESLLETLINYAPLLKTLDLRNYFGNDVGKSNLSLIKMYLRKLTKEGTTIAFSRAKGHI